MNVSTPSRRTATAVAKAVSAVTEPLTSTADTASAPIENEANAPTSGDAKATLLEAECKWAAAKYLLSACLDSYTADINYAADSLIEAAYQLLCFAAEHSDFRKADEAHAEMWRAAAVVQYRMSDNACGGEEMFALEGIHHLMTEAMGLVEEALATAVEGDQQ